MLIARNTVVTLKYSVKDTDGTSIDEGAAPLVYLHGGYGGIFDRIEEELQGKAVGDALELIVDGGVRRGTHVLKALALGANACSIGRGYLYALAAGGEAGVSRALTLLRGEIERDMALVGVNSISSISREILTPAA